jgi:hypothetical protein
MKKTLILISLFSFSLLYILSESSSPKNLLNETSTAPTEHNILLDLAHKDDRLIFDNLVYSNYNCTMINPKQAVCSQFQPAASTLMTRGAQELYKYSTSNGDQEFKIVRLSNGEAHIEFKLDSSKTLYRYSFSSVEQIPLFAAKKGLFTTGKVEWDISSLEHLL